MGDSYSPASSGVWFNNLALQVFSMFKNPFAILLAVILSACVTVTPGPEKDAANARKIEPVEGKVSVYFCREWAYAGSAISVFPMVSGNIVASLQTKTYTKIDLEPGKYEIRLSYTDEKSSGFAKAFSREPVLMEVLDGKGGSIQHYWIGMAGSSLFGGSFTIDHFDNNAQARSCIQESTYVSPR